MGERVTARYFLHVLPDGTEQRFDHHPLHVPCKIVEIIGECEQTYTKISINGERIIPPGKGWTFHAHDDHDFAIWRRPKTNPPAG